MEQILRNKSSFLHYLCLRILFWEIRIQVIISFFLFYYQCLCNFVGQKWRAWIRNRNPTSPEPLKHIERGIKLSKEEVIVVMENLGIGVELDGDGIEVYGEQEISDLFEKEPSLAEVKAAFDVFDENKDGFIEAKDLQRVLRCLGLQRNLEECRRMIKVVDENGDGLIDHSDFLKLIERCFFNSCGDS
ncbi:hypothetical protein L6164_020810 [Bauhinia variegata]|uniref:Uncharacterized protein n=1 Tax=Bauhinia variegata TaxID=167791 RepID=A0ACB9MXV5_BAUVA|nr:hypothetical protein L6164_020810 [Bauhinia variegata]